MPYKLKEMKSQRQRERRQLKPLTTEAPVNEVPVNLSNPDLPKEWQKVKDYISKGNNLEKLQQIAWALGKHAEDVYFGIDGLTIKDIGEVIGTKPFELSKTLCHVT